MGEMDIGPIPATFRPITQGTMVDCYIYLVIISIWMILFMKIKAVIVGVMVQDL